MDYTNEIQEFGLSILKKVALEVAPDDILNGLDSLVRTATDFDMSGQEKFEWVKGKALELALGFWELILPLLVQAIYEAIQSKAR